MADKSYKIDSDIDIAGYFNSKTKDLSSKRLKLSKKISFYAKRDSEIVVLNEIKSIFFKFVIIKEKILIFENDHNARIDFELKTMNKYYDFKPFLKKYNQFYLERHLNKFS